MRTGFVHSNWLMSRDQFCACRCADFAALWQHAWGQQRFSEGNHLLKRNIQLLHHGHDALCLAWRTPQPLIRALPWMHLVVDNFLPQNAIFADPAWLPIADHSIDTILLFFFLHFIPHPQQVLHEAARVVKYGGQIIVVGSKLPPRYLRNRFYRAPPLHILHRAHHLHGRQVSEEGARRGLSVRFQAQQGNSWLLLLDKRGMMPIQQKRSSLLRLLQPLPQAAAS